VIHTCRQVVCGIFFPNTLLSIHPECTDLEELVLSAGGRVERLHDSNKQLLDGDALVHNARCVVERIGDTSHCFVIPIKNNRVELFELLAEEVQVSVVTQLALCKSITEQVPLQVLSTEELKRLRQRWGQ